MSDLLRTCLTGYVELLERLIASDEGVDGEAVPRELRDILATTLPPRATLFVSGADPDEVIDWATDPRVQVFYD